MKNEKVSVVIPVYNCNQTIGPLCTRLVSVFSEINKLYEIILVDDFCPMNSWDIIEDLCKDNPNIKGVKLTRNFGQHQAITAGLSHSKGDLIVVMDGDLQDKPEVIKKLYKTYKDNDSDVVLVRRVNRQDNAFKKINSKIFYFILEAFTDEKFDSTTANFGIYSKRVIDKYLELHEQTRAFPILVKWLSYKASYIDIPHTKREIGNSSYNFSKLINLALDIIISQSNKPLKITVKMGFVIALTSLILLVWLFIKKLIYEVPLGWTSIIMSIFFVGGLILTMLGVIGLYVGKIFDEVRKRPYFVVQSSLNINNNKSIPL